MANTTTIEILDKPKKSVDQTRTVDHKLFKFNTTRDNGVIVCFEVGYYERPSAEHQRAQQHVMDTLAKLSQELAMMRTWGGSVSVCGMTENIVNPTITESMIEGFVAAAVQAYPEMQLVEHWQNSMHGVRGYSVWMQPKS